MEFPNVRCLDAEEEVFSSENTVVLGVPPTFSRSDLTHTVLRTIFWSMTHPMGNIVLLKSTGTYKNLLPIRGSRLEAPVSLWALGNSRENALSIDSSGKKFFVTNRCFSSASSLSPLPSYSPTAFVEIVNTGGNLQEREEPYEHAFSV
jgi:hypothetical protein